MGEEIDIFEECKYSLDRGIEYYTERLASIMQVVGYLRGGTSAHVFTKEIRNALELVTLHLGERASDFIPDIVRSHVPTEIHSKTAALCYMGLLEGLLKKFLEYTKNMPPGVRIELMNIIVNSIYRMARFGLTRSGEEFKQKLFGKSNPVPVPKTSGGEKV